MEEAIREVEILQRDTVTTADEEASSSVFQSDAEECSKLVVSPRINLLLVRGPIFDVCSATITIIITFVLVINYLIMSERVDAKDMPFISKKLEEKFDRDHQRVFRFPNVKVSSHYDSGNLKSIRQNAPYEFEMKVGGESTSSLRRWFMFSLMTMRQPVTMIFLVSNLTLESDLLENGVVPVYRSEATGEDWMKLEGVTKVRQIDTNELEVEFRYLYDPGNDGTIQFALDFPHTVHDENRWHRRLQSSLKDRSDLFFELQTLCRSKEGQPLNLLLLSTATNVLPNTRFSYEGARIPGLAQNKSLFVVAARIRGHETYSSICIKHLTSLLTKRSKLSTALLDKYLFLIIPMVNPDGVKHGYSTEDSSGNDIDSYYLDASDSRSSETFHLRSLINKLAHLNHIGVFLSLRSLKSTAELSVAVPPLDASNQDHQLLLAYTFNKEIAAFDPSQQVQISNSTMLKAVSIEARHAVVASIGIPTLKRLPDGRQGVKDLETSVPGSHGMSLGDIKAVARQIRLVLHKALASRKSKREVSEYRKTAAAMFSHLIRSEQ